MVHYFPPIYPDELLYSILARYHRHMGGQNQRQTLADLFGNIHHVATAALPGHLADLSRNLPPERGLTPQHLAWNHTLYPYYAAYQPELVAATVLQNMMAGPATPAQLRLGVNASTVSAPRRLRFCPYCFRRDADIHGEAWWHRAHQLPGVVVCPDHGQPLRDSIVQPGLEHRHGYFAATEETCRLDGTDVAFDSEAGSLLQDIAERSRRLLEDPPDRPPPASLAAEYRQALAERGLTRGPRHVDQRHLAEEFERVFRPLLAIIPGLEDPARHEWLSTIACKPTKAFHPFHHILFGLLLDKLPVRSPAWADRPQAAAHTASDLEPQRAQRREHWLAAQREHPDFSRKELARLLPADRAWLAHHDRSWLEVNSPPPKAPNRHTPRVDWPALDRDLTERVRAAVADIIRTVPPVRATLTEVGRRIGRRGVLRHGEARLPLTTAALDDTLESLEAFRLRRIAWAAHELECAGLPLRAWRIRQIASVRGGGPAIEAALRRYEAPCRW